MLSAFIFRFQVSGFWFLVSGFGLQVSGLGFRFRVSSFRFWVLCSGFRTCKRSWRIASTPSDARYSGSAWLQTMCRVSGSRQPRFLKPKPCGNQHAGRLISTHKVSCKENRFPLQETCKGNRFPLQKTCRGNRIPLQVSCKGNRNLVRGYAPSAFSVLRISAQR